MFKAAVPRTLLTRTNHLHEEVMVQAAYVPCVSFPDISYLLFSRASQAHFLRRGGSFKLLPECISKEI